MTGLLDIKVAAGVRMVGTRLIALVPTVAMAVAFEASNTFDAAAQLLNVAQSLLLPFALLPVVHMTASAQVMGSRWVTGRLMTGLCAAITALVIAINGYLLVDMLMAQHAGGLTWYWISVLAGTTGLYYALVAYYAIGPEHVPGLMQRGHKCGLQAVDWVRHRVRRLDPESMVEVHW
jgi:hypothetical protein